VGGGKDRVTDHWLYRLLGKKPNRYQNPFEWREMLQGHLALRGNAFCQILANGRGEITELTVRRCHKTGGLHHGGEDTHFLILVHCSDILNSRFRYGLFIFY
jgi:hypothetical protein